MVSTETKLYIYNGIIGCVCICIYTHTAHTTLISRTSGKITHHVGGSYHLGEGIPESFMSVFFPPVSTLNITFLLSVKQYLNCRSTNLCSETHLPKTVPGRPRSKGPRAPAAHAAAPDGKDGLSRARPVLRSNLTASRGSCLLCA